MSARQNALYRGGLLVSADAVLGGIGLAALLAFLAVPRRFYIWGKISLWKQKKRLRNIMMDMTRMIALFRNTAWWNTLPR